MEIRTLTTGEELRRYNEWLLTNPHRNLWQSLEWKRYQESLGRSVKIYATEEAGKITASAMVMIDTTVLGLSTWDIPRGPLWNIENEKNIVDLLLERIIDDAKKDRCIELYFSPASQFSMFNFQCSMRHIYPEATRVVDLTQNESNILAQMHPKGRYNISLARKHGITVETHDLRVSTASNIDAFYDLLKSTGGRDGFVISQKSYYARFLSDLRGSFMLTAKYQEKTIAGLIGVTWNKVGIYYYGASSYEHRHLMAPYLLQWEAMLYCKKAGCARYDLLGIAPERSAKDNPWAGITDFKRKFGGVVVNYPPEQMVVLRPIAKRMLEWKRRVVG